MDYTINTSVLDERIEQEISRVAASSYSEDGGSLYDAVRVTSRDEAIIEEYRQAAVSAICAAFAEYATWGSGVISFDLPDFDHSMSESVVSELNRYIVNFACSEWFKDKSVKDVDSYVERANDALNKANVLLKSRKPPKRK